MALAGALIGFGLLGQGIGAYEASRAQAGALREQADQAVKNAKAAKESAAFNAERQAFIARKIISGTKAGFAAAGVSSTSGSVLSVMAESNVNAELDRLNIIHEGNVRAQNFYNEALSKRSAARASERSGIFDVLSMGFQGAGKLSET